MHGVVNLKNFVTDSQLETSDICHRGTAHKSYRAESADHETID